MICGIVLAAGFSLRMGTQKLLLPFAGKTVIAYIVDLLRESKLGEIVVVVGRDGERVAAELAGRRVRIVSNPHPEEGMLSSVRAGLEAVPHGCAGVLVALGDQPAIRTELVDRMIDGFSEGKILIPCFGGKRGHPLLFSAEFREEILTKYQDVGLRGLLEAHAAEVIELEVADRAVLEDMDFPEDYRRELERNEGK